MQLTHIPAHEQEGVLSSFWTMLKEAESKADNENDPVLKHWVEQWFGQWNRITGSESKAKWVERAAASDPAQATRG